MRTLLLASAALLPLMGTAHAVNIVSFGQAIAGQAPIIGTANDPAAGQTTIATTNAEVSVTSCLGCGALVSPQLLTLHAVSTNAATNVGGVVTQDFSGSFSILAGPVNVLSADFTDAVFGAGTSLVVSVSNASPGEALSFTSDVIPAALLHNPEGMSLSFADVLPPAGTVDPTGCNGTVGCTLASFHSSVAGTFSSTPVPEPATLAILGIGLLGLGLTRRLRIR